jgi:hypothetical protein
MAASKPVSRMIGPDGPTIAQT